MFVLVVTEDGDERKLAKRYSDFEAVHAKLGDNIAFPSKAAFAMNFFKSEEDKLEERRQALEEWIGNAITMPRHVANGNMLAFLGAEVVATVPAAVTQDEAAVSVDEIQLKAAAADTKDLFSADDDEDLQEDMDLFSPEKTRQEEEDDLFSPSSAAVSESPTLSDAISKSGGGGLFADEENEDSLFGGGATASQPAAVSNGNVAANTADDDILDSDDDDAGFGMDDELITRDSVGFGIAEEAADTVVSTHTQSSPQRNPHHNVMSKCPTITCL